MNTAADIDAMLAASTFAVVGAARDPAKYGYKVYHDLKQAGKTAYAVNPNADLVDGDLCYATLSALPKVPQVVSIITPPAVTEGIVQECARLGIKNIWIQPGAESNVTLEFCRAHGIVVVAGGPCILVGLRTHALLPH